MRYKNLIILFLIILFAGCGIKPEPTPPPSSIKTEAIKPEISLIKLPISEYPDFKDDNDYKNINQSIIGSISYLKKINQERAFTFGDDNYSASYLIKSLQTFSNFIAKNPNSKELNEFIKTNYSVYQSIGSNDKKEALFTGYFESVLQGSLKESKNFPFPLYAPPDDLITIDLSEFSSDLKGKKIIGRISGNRFVPYYNRYEIEYENAISKKAKPIAWIKNRIDRFFLEIQGSGKVLLDNGKTINVHYNGYNGREYNSIGTMLIKEGKIKPEEMSMQRIYSYLEKNPDEIKRVLTHNQSFVFFKTEKEGPIGCINVKLTPERSIATDRKIFPQAALSYIETQKPVIDEKNNTIIAWEDMKRFVQNQDTGGAIKGAGRVDFFWGNGAYANLAAGNMKHKGKLFFLVLKK